MALNAQQAAESAGQFSRAMNRSRHTPPIPEMFKRTAEENKLYIFNVGPWRRERPLGSAGHYKIGACPEGKEYSDPIIIPGVHIEPYPENEHENKLLYEDGEALAMQVLGEGPMVPRSSSWKPYGCFVTRNAVPTKAELKAANEELQKKYTELIAQANEAHALGPLKAREVIDPMYHHVAARKMKKSIAECPWLANSEAPAERDDCPGCGTVYRVGIMKCKDCGYILDQTKYDKAKKDGRFAA